MQLEGGATMLLTYVTDKSFGPSGSFAGYFLMGVGLFTIFLSISGAVLLLMGSFWAFPVWACWLVGTLFRFRFPTICWGFLRVGSWRTLTGRCRLGLGMPEWHTRYTV